MLACLACTCYARRFDNTEDQQSVDQTYGAGCTHRLAPLASLLVLSPAVAFRVVNTRPRVVVGSASRQASLTALGNGIRSATIMSADGDGQSSPGTGAPSTKIVPSAVAGEKNWLAELPIPSPIPFIYAFIVVANFQALSESKALLNWVASGFILSNLPIVELVFRAGFVGFFSKKIVDMVLPGKAGFYKDLEGLELNSLSKQAAEWAEEDVVPTRLGDDEVATFAGGCFWGTELHFQRIPGVTATCVGYTQGRPQFPNYDQICSGSTGHTEGIMMTYDPSVISYGELCDKLLSTVDATRLNAVGNDMGTQYRHGLYPNSDEQYEEAIAAILREQSRRDSQDQKVVTEVKRASVFYPAEKYHQRYLEKGGQSASKGASVPVRCYG